MTAAETRCEACLPEIQVYEARGKRWVPTPVGARVHAAYHASIAELRVENAEVLHALHHHTDCNDAKQAKAERDAANARVGELEGALGLVYKAWDLDDPACFDDPESWNDGWLEAAKSVKKARRVLGEGK